MTYQVGCFQRVRVLIEAPWIQTFFLHVPKVSDNSASGVVDQNGQVQANQNGDQQQPQQQQPPQQQPQQQGTGALQVLGVDDNNDFDKMPGLPQEAQLTDAERQVMQKLLDPGVPRDLRQMLLENLKAALKTPKPGEQKWPLASK